MSSGRLGLSPLSLMRWSIMVSRVAVESTSKGWGSIGARRII